MKNYPAGKEFSMLSRATGMYLICSDIPINQITASVCMFVVFFSLYDDRVK